jgi:predicted transcriptional regulator
LYVVFQQIYLQLCVLQKRSYFMPSEKLIQLGQIIKKRRQTLLLSQEEFADLVGVHRTYIGMIERAEKNITFLNIEKIANALKISVGELLKDI